MPPGSSDPGDPSPSADSVPLRIAGCLHALVLEGKETWLAGVYPPDVVDDDTLWAAIHDAEELKRRLGA